MPMNLDQDLAAYLAKNSNEHSKPFEEQTISELRKWHLESSLKSSGTVEGVITKDISFENDGVSIPLRLYKPENMVTNLPTFIFFHGGGWILGSIQSHDYVPRKIAKLANIAAISVGYRLAPEHRAPAAVSDAIAAFNWIRNHGSELGVDSDRLAVGGDSAGGNLAAVLAIIAQQNSIPLRCQVLIYPVTDLRPSSWSLPSRNTESPGLTKEELEYMAGQFLVDETQTYDWRLSPIISDSLEGVAPALIITAANDVLHDDGEMYADRLVNAGVPVVRRNFPGMIHGFIKMSFTEASDSAMRTITFVLDEFLK